MHVTYPSPASLEQTPSLGHFLWLRQVCVLVPARLKLLPLDPSCKKAEAEENKHTDVICLSCFLGSDCPLTYLEVGSLILSVWWRWHVGLSELVDQAIKEGLGTNERLCHCVCLWMTPGCLCMCLFLVCLSVVCLCVHLPVFVCVLSLYMCLCFCVFVYFSSFVCVCVCSVSVYVCLCVLCLSVYVLCACVFSVCVNVCLCLSVFCV